MINKYIIHRLTRVSTHLKYAIANIGKNILNFLNINPEDTTQETTEGRNKLDVSTFIQGTWNISSNSRIVSFVCPVSTGDKLTIQNFNTTAYIFACGISDHDTRTEGATTTDDSGWQTDTSYTITASQNGFLWLQIRKPTGTITPSEILETDFMVENGSTAHDWEKYTGGMSSPNPSYPSNIEVVTGDNQVIVSNKNLFDDSTTTKVLISNDGIENANGNVKTSTYIKVDTNNSYIYSCSLLTGATSSWVNVSYYGKNKNYLSYQFFNSTPVQLTLPTNCKYLRLGYHINFVEKVQLEVGSSASEYVEHEEQVYPINLLNIELAKISTHKDKLFKAIEGDVVYDSLTSTQKEGLTEGNWYKYGAIGKVVLNGEESFAVSSSGGLYRYNTSVISDSINTTSRETILSNYYHYEGNSNVVSNCFVYQAKFFFYPEQTITTVALFQNWLSTHNTTVYYALATPTFTEITDTTLIQQLDTLKTALNRKNISEITLELDGNTLIIV